MTNCCANNNGNNRQQIFANIRSHRRRGSRPKEWVPPLSQRFFLSPPVRQPCAPTVFVCAFFAEMRSVLLSGVAESLRRSEGFPLRSTGGVREVTDHHSEEVRNCHIDLYWGAHISVWRSRGWGGVVFPPSGLTVWPDWWQVQAFPGSCRGCKSIVSRVMKSLNGDKSRVMNVNCAIIHFKTYYRRKSFSIKVIVLFHSHLLKGENRTAPEPNLQEDGATQTYLQQDRQPLQRQTDWFLNKEWKHKGNLCQDKVM